MCVECTGQRFPWRKSHEVTDSEHWLPRWILVHYGDSANEDLGWMDIQDERKARLRALNLKKGTRFHYEYDFGDSWMHTLVVEKILPLEKGMKLPQCIRGKRACPPEDVGEPWGYEGFLEAMRDPEHEEHQQYMEWIGGEFDPEAFDLEVTMLAFSSATSRVGWGRILCQQQGGRSMAAMAVRSLALVRSPK